MHSNVPPRKKRRLAMPEFESSFDSKVEGTSRSWKQCQRKDQTFGSSSRSHLFEGINAAEEALVSPTQTQTVEDTKPDISFPLEASSPSVARRMPHMSTALADFSSTFGLEKKNRDRHTIISPRPARERNEDGTMGQTRDQPRIKLNNFHKMPLRVFTSPQLQGRRININSGGVKNIAPSTSSLPLMPSFISEFRDDTPKKVINLLSPKILATESTPVVTPSKISHVERAGHLAQAAHNTHKARLSEMTISNFIQGMDISPQKNTDERRKFVRGGLAERVQHLLTKSRTNVLLWQTERSKNCSKLATGNLNLVISSIISSTYHPTVIYRPVPSVNPRTILTMCSFLEERSKAETLTLVVFMLSSGISTADFQVGKKVHIWHPWHRIRIPHRDKKLIGGCWVETSTSNNSDAFITALLCPRFSLAY